MSIAESLEVIEPATENVMASVPLGGIEEIDDAVRRAKAAFPAWRGVTPKDRSLLLSRIADLVERDLEEMSTLEARNAGKPISDAWGEISVVVDTFRYFAGAPERLLGDTIPVAGGVNMTFREPLGVVGLITPWNFPLAIASWKIAPALAAGNTVVLKPAALTPLTALRLAEIAPEAGLPEGVLNVVAGSGRLIGERLVSNPDVAKIAFTGSTSVGRRIGALAAEDIKRVTLELGGKSASVIFEDADLETAAAAAPAGVFGNAGQDCCARARILVQKSVFDEFVDLFSKTVSEIRVGDPLEPETEMGPLISADQRKTVASFLDDGTPVICQGSGPDGPGFWFPPTVLGPVSNDDRVARDEIFGPIACLLPFETESEAVEIANQTIYGLSGSIWTRDGGRAMRVARAIDSGTLSVNSNTSVRVTTPFGGFKQSGIGRELGPSALDYYTELKNVFMAT